MRNLSNIYLAKYSHLKTKSKMFYHGTHASSTPIFTNDAHFKKYIKVEYGYYDIKKIKDGTWRDADYDEEMLYRADVAPSSVINGLNVKDWKKFQKFIE